MDYEKLIRELVDVKIKHTNSSLENLNAYENGMRDIVKQLPIADVSQQRELLITAFTEADRTGYIELLTNAETIADKVISGNL